MNNYPTLKLLFVPLVLFALLVLLAGCGWPEGYPRYQPSSCSVVEWPGGAAESAEWECN